MLNRLFKIAKIIWASPYSALGLLVGIVGLCTGGSGRFRDGALEFYGGATKRLVRRLPTGIQTVGFTLGHVILGQDEAGLRDVGYHERVHVAQFERWGPLMGPAYLLSSAWLWMRGRDYYRDNPFEVEAYRLEELHSNSLPVFFDHTSGESAQATTNTPYESRKCN